MMKHESLKYFDAQSQKSTKRASITEAHRAYTL